MKGVYSMHDENKFLNKTITMTEELLQHQLSEIVFWIEILGVISLVSVLVLMIIERAIKKDIIDDTVGLAILPIILFPMLGFVLSIGFYVLYPQAYPVGKSEITINSGVSEIKEHITIQDNIMTIDALPKQYNYVSSLLDGNESQQFIILGKVDNKLTIKDQNGRKYKIDDISFTN